MKYLYCLLVIFSFNFSFCQSKLFEEIIKIDSTIPNNTGWKDKSFEDFLIYKNQIEADFFDENQNQFAEYRNVIYYLYLGSIPNHGKVNKIVGVKIKNLDTGEIIHYISSNEDEIIKLKKGKENDLSNEYFAFLCEDYKVTKGLNILKYTDSSETFHSLDYHMIEFIYKINLENESNGMVFSSYNYYTSEKMLDRF
ncbi:hypothetical protein EG240_08960 [Paenimyroides tangerinum]|uniref:Uncharacterized protein n=1 Tax=Paenimyroides tangerinum TaxID=2488728 RepID=A0A3P3W5G1_9FLAO|nr:hypothetical protein [Paenimyroides tangerinum]RRJ90371.1 hypothetical protein EG240_08960 [Paenimyroides tangerinum]